jgi:hypothetical protein
MLPTNQTKSMKRTKAMRVTTNTKLKRPMAMARKAAEPLPLLTMELSYFRGKRARE